MAHLPLDAYGKAADIYRLLGFQRQAALSYSGAGYIAGMLGNPDKELELKKMGLGLIRKANDLIREAYYLCSLGWAYGKQKDILKASESFNAALEMARDRDDRQLEMQALWGIGAIHGYLKQHQQAKQPLLKALSLARELKNAQVEGAILHNLSTISLRSKEVAEARTFATQELQVGEATKDFSRIGYARYQLAAALLEEGKPAEAIPLLKEVVSIIENVRGRLVSEEARLGFLEGKDVAYYDLIRALILLHGQGDIKGYDREAFEYTERARTRTLLEFVSALREKQGSASGLVRREITLRYRIASLNTQLTTNDFKPQSERLNPSYLQAEREAAYREYTEVLAEMKRTTGGGFPSSTADPISLKEIQSLLTDGAVLIEYVVTRTQLIIWVVSADGLHPILVPVDQEDLNSRISSFRNKLERHSSDFEKDAKDLYRFLITPIQPFLSGAKRLVISPHGELHHVAFGALINPQTNQFLVAGASLSFIPSASLLKWVQKHPGPSGYKVLALGIGTFDKLPQLAQAETEAVTVGNAFNDRLILVGSEATIGRFKEEASHYDIIHIASHAEIDSDAPLLSRIILKDGLGRDTSLYTSDVFELTLRASLVTLSACETSLGKIGAGNEVLGFVRGFLFAGVSSVVASQWRVDDIATSELMIEMYTSIKDGRPKDEALQAAQKRLLASKMHSHPYYWAGFFLTGDRR
jgi:CHAT domain-containing protein